MATLTTEWQTVSTTQKNFSSINWIKYYIDAKVGSPNVAAGTIPIYTRLRSEVNANGWAGAGYKWSLTYAQHTASAETWEGSDTWYFGTETILETITATNIKYDKEGNFIKRWDCAKDASRELGISNSAICACARGTRKTAGGFVWKYE